VEPANCISDNFHLEGSALLNSSTTSGICFVPALTEGLAAGFASFPLVLECVLFFSVLLLLWGAAALPLSPVAIVLRLRRLEINLSSFYNLKLTD
jgi:hypothetical protein